MWEFGMLGVAHEYGGALGAGMWGMKLEDS